MKLIKQYATKHDCLKNDRTIKVKGLMLHSVGCNQPSAKVFADRWNKAGSTVLAHAVLDASGEVYKVMPWNHRGWHAGSGKNGSANNTHIGVEVTEPKQIRYTSGSGFTVLDRAACLAQVKGAYKTAVELFAYLCDLYGLDPMADGVIISHAEGHKRGIASDHGDIDHLWKGLNCGYTMDGFRKDVKKALEPIVPKPCEVTPGETFNASTTAALALRSEPGTQNGTTYMYMPKGKKVIVLKDKAAEADGYSWAFISYDGFCGYCADKYLTI